MIDEAMKNSRRHLGELAAMQHRVNESEKRILERATVRLDEVNARIEELRPDAMQKPDEYQDLILERGKLNIVIAHARAATN